MWHRPLSETLTDVFEAVTTAWKVGLPVRATRVELKLPIEVWLRDVKGESTFIADLPVWRWRTDFDQPPGRLQVTYEERQL